MNAMKIEVGKQYKSSQKIVTVTDVNVQADENGKPNIVIGFEYDEGQMVGGIKGLIRTAERDFEDFCEIYQAI